MLPNKKKPVSGFFLPPKFGYKPKAGELPELDKLDLGETLGENLARKEKQEEQLKKYVKKKKEEKKKRKKKRKERKDKKPRVNKVKHSKKEPPLWKYVFDLLSDPENWGKTYDEIAKEVGVDVKLIEDTVKNNPELQEALAELEIRRKLRYMQDKLPSVIEAMTEKALQGDPRAAAIIFRWLGIKEGGDKDDKKKDVIKISFYDPLLYQIWGPNAYQEREGQIGEMKRKTEEIEKIIEEAQEIDREAKKELEEQEITPPEEVSMDLQNQDGEVIELNEIKEKEGTEEGNEYIDIAKEGD